MFPDITGHPLCFCWEGGFLRAVDVLGMVVWSNNCVLNVKRKIFPHFGKMLPNMFPDMPDDVVRCPHRQECWGTLICYRVQYAGIHVFPGTHFLIFAFVLCVHSLHSALCNCRGALCTWLGLPSPRHSVVCIMPCLPPEFNPTEHALEVMETSKLKVGTPVLGQKRQSRGGVYFGTISKVPKAGKPVPMLTNCEVVGQCTTHKRGYELPTVVQVYRQASNGVDVCKNVCETNRMRTWSAAVCTLVMRYAGRGERLHGCQLPGCAPTQPDAW